VVGGGTRSCTEASFLAAPHLQSVAVAERLEVAQPGSSVPAKECRGLGRTPGPSGSPKW
jgi:hypothetical protein